MTASSLRRWRLSLGMTQAQLGDFLDIHRVTVSNMETGSAEVPVMLTLLISYETAWSALRAHNAGVHTHRLDTVGTVTATKTSQPPALTDPEYEEVGAEQGYEGDGQDTHSTERMG